VKELRPNVMGHASVDYHHVMSKRFTCSSISLLLVGVDRSFIAARDSDSMLRHFPEHVCSGGMPIIYDDATTVFTQRYELHTLDDKGELHRKNVR
jgi:hypothetical protein